MDHEYRGHHFAGDAESQEDDANLYQRLSGSLIHDIQPSYHDDLRDV
jgi:hypothetical protein